MSENSVPLYDGERIDDLQLDGLRIIQKKGTFCFGMDAVLLADFAKCNSRSIVCDLGSGSGILGFLLFARYGFSHMDAVEISADMAERCGRSVKLNGLAEKISVHNADLREISVLLPRERYDTVITNPPYSRASSALPNSVPIKQIARQDNTCSLENTVSAAYYLLKSRGSLYMVYPASRSAEACECLHAYHIEVKEEQFVHSYISSPARLVLLRAVKDAAPGVRVFPPLIAKNPDGSDTDGIRKIYHLL